MDIMHSLGMKVEKIHAGKANMFLNPVFRNTLAGVTGAGIELYDTDGSVGAAIGAGIGKGIFKDAKEAFSLIRKTDIIEPSSDRRYLEAYSRWKEELDKHLKQ